MSLFYSFTDTKSRYEVFPAPAAAREPASRPPAYADFVGRTSAIAPGYRYDSRNDPFDPTRGRRFGLSMTMAGGVAGGRLLVRQAASATRPSTNAQPQVALAVNVEGGLVRPYDGQESRSSSGSGSAATGPSAGFQYGSIYPLDENDQAFFNEQGALLGGDKYLVLNVEAVYYVAGPLKFVLFFDAGNAWLEGQTFNPLKMRASAGVELRMFLPIFQARSGSSTA